MAVRGHVSAAAIESKIENEVHRRSDMHGLLGSQQAREEHLVIPSIDDRLARRRFRDRERRKKGMLPGVAAAVLQPQEQVAPVPDEVTVSSEI